MKACVGEADILPCCPGIFALGCGRGFLEGDQVDKWCEDGPVSDEEAPWDLSVLCRGSCEGD